ELRAAVRAREKLAGRVAEYRVAELLFTVPLRNGRRVVRHVFSAEELLEAKMIASCGREAAVGGRSRGRQRHPGREGPGRESPGRQGKFHRAIFRPVGGRDG